MKKVSILGSTGSIGTQTLEVIRTNRDIEVTALAASCNIDLLEQQIREFNPKLACVFEKSAALELEKRLTGFPIEIVTGMEGLIACAAQTDAELVVTAVVGMIGILPTIAAIKAGKDIALANKETLVTAGHLILPFARQHHVRLLPVDSEHSAIFQALQGVQEKPVKNVIEKIILTASGGPFRGRTKKELKNIQVEDALKHPNWSMGRKITIDSATMVNKGLEVMEAKWLFDVEPEKIEVVIQPQSILHSAVQFCDGSIIAQMGTPDMKLPIQYAIYYPERRALSSQRVDFFTLSKMEFEQPDYSTFTSLKLAFEVIKTGGSLPTVYNAANEYAVSLFLNRKIQFLAISELIADAVSAHSVISEPDVNQILNAEAETYVYIKREAKKLKYMM